MKYIRFLVSYKVVPTLDFFMYLWIQNFSIFNSIFSFVVLKTEQLLPKPVFHFGIR